MHVLGLIITGHDHVSHEHGTYSWAPDELIYSLMIGNETAGDFHDWLETWQRSSNI